MTDDEEGPYKPPAVPDIEEVRRFDPKGLRADRSYCPNIACPEWDGCAKRLFPFVKMFCPKLR